MIKKENIAFCIILWSAMACSPTKRLVEGEYLLQKNKLETHDIKLSNDELQAIIKQQPNRRILPFLRFHLHMYNLPTVHRLEVSRTKKDERIAKRNERRAAKGKSLKGPGRTKWEYFKEVVGEPPVILDTAAVYASSQQLSTYLVKKGYFINEVTDSIVRNPNRKMAKVYYTLNWEKPYILDSMRYRIDDPNIESMIRQGFEFKDLELGKRFDVEVLANERENITKFLRNKGYYLFTHDYIEFEVDSTLGEHRVAVDLILKSPSESPPDALGVKYHPTYRLGSIYFNYDIPVSSVSDTLNLKGYSFIDHELFPLNPKVLSQNTFLTTDMAYQQDRVELTYRRLSSLPALSHVSIRFEPRDRLLDVFVTMVPAKRQTISFETQGTNSSGYLGIEGDLVYRHRNIFKGSEILELRFQGGIQSQALISSSASSGNIQQGSNVTLNTIEFGPSVTLRLPKFLLPIAQDKFAKSADPSTVLTAAFSYQNRPDFKREVSSLSFGWQWHESVEKTHQVNLFEASIIRINKSQAFQDRLDALNDRFLSDSYRNHFITATTYTFTYNEQKTDDSKNLFYFRGNAELGGNLLRAGFKAFGQPTDSIGSYEIIGIRFANFVKGYTDTRFYRRFDDKRTLACRVAGGIGVPYGNLNVLPFSKSFFGGGANGLRAWKARTIGPGSYFEPLVAYDKIGDVILEANVEYRFNLIGYLDGAFFIDAGNIWLLNKDEVRPGAAFAADRFLSEFGVGGGMGFRIDFTFFILRFDLAAQLKDPSLVPGERWVFQPKDKYNAAIDQYNSNLEDGVSGLNPYRLRLNLNLGIGYPF